MRKRSRAREFALQILYQIDITREEADNCLRLFWQNFTAEPPGEDLRDFTEALVRGVAGNLKEIDEHISAHAANWQLSRMAVVDRNILRLGCFELTKREDIPPKVSINEAVELAKKYSGVEAGKFVNAILDKIRLQQKR